MRRTGHKEQEASWGNPGAVILRVLSRWMELIKGNKIQQAQIT